MLKMLVKPMYVAYKFISISKCELRMHCTCNVQATHIDSKLEYTQGKVYAIVVKVDMVSIAVR